MDCVAHIISCLQRDLTKRRENKARAELAGKTDKVNTLRQEIAENENQLNMAQVSDSGIRINFSILGSCIFFSFFFSLLSLFHQQKFYQKSKHILHKPRDYPGLIL